MEEVNEKLGMGWIPDLHFFAIGSSIGGSKWARLSELETEASHRRGA